jgi:hypothetical protein
LTARDERRHVGTEIPNDSVGNRQHRQTMIAAGTALIERGRGAVEQACSFLHRQEFHCSSLFFLCSSSSILKSQRGRASTKTFPLGFPEQSAGDDADIVILLDYKPPFK